MQRNTIDTYGLRTIDWFNNKIVDWNSAGTQYSNSDETTQLWKYHFGFVCDGSITSENGEYVLIYQKLGTKGLLLKNGELIREINRSYYQSSAYEYPATFFTYENRTFLAHCPNAYCQLDFEDVETGEILTAIEGREPQDYFHSRLEVSPDNKYLISKGWYWHPFDSVELFDIVACFSNPKLLDRGKSMPNVVSEVCSASFIDNDRILVSASNEEPLDDEDDGAIPPLHIGVWNIKTDEIESSKRVDGEFGNVFAINEKWCWDLYKYPKIIDYTTGTIIDKLEEISSGKQQSSIIHHLKDVPRISFNRETGQIAIAWDNKIEILTP